MIKLGMMARQTQDSTIESIIDFAYELKLDVIELHLAGIPAIVIACAGSSSCASSAACPSAT